MWISLQAKGSSCHQQSVALTTTLCGIAVQVTFISFLYAGLLRCWANHLMCVITEQEQYMAARSVLGTVSPKPWHRQHYTRHDYRYIPLFCAWCLNCILLAFPDLLWHAWRKIIWYAQNSFVCEFLDPFCRGLCCRTLAGSSIFKLAIAPSAVGPAVGPSELHPNNNSVVCILMHSWWLD